MLFAEKRYNKAVELEQKGDFAGALVRFMWLAAGGHTKARGKVAHMYLEGIGTSVNYKNAFYWAKSGAGQGDVLAISTLAKCYLYGHGVQQDVFKARELYQKAAELGDEQALEYFNALDDVLNIDFSELFQEDKPSVLPAECNNSHTPLNNTAENLLTEIGNLKLCVEDDFDHLFDGIVADATSTQYNEPTAT